MTSERRTETSQEITARGRTTGAFRCLNCFERNTAPSGSKSYKCPKCGFEWRLSWPTPTQPRIRGPVWDVNKRLAEEALKKMGKEGN
jgi:predicted RNA-binding Zn-ribbon protein involved in translation (DUF1610 family)